MANHQRWASLGQMLSHMAQRQEWVPLSEAAELYRVTPETMLSWVRLGRFRSRTYGSRTWVARGELLEALRRRPPRA